MISSIATSPDSIDVRRIDCPAFGIDYEHEHRDAELAKKEGGGAPFPP
jgi:hypothetical protein